VYTHFSALARAEAPEVFPLNVGDTYLLPPLPARAETLRTADLPGLHNYADVQGHPALLDAIVEHMRQRGRPVERAHLQVTAGATSGLDLVCRALFGPGDEVIVLAPYWPLIRGIVSSTGATVVELPCFTELHQPAFDLRAALERVTTPRTSGIYVNHPHNPTGAVLTHAQIATFASFAADHGLWVLSDEAYEHLHFQVSAPAALWMHPQLVERTIAAHTFSKSYGVAGARVGFVHGPEEAMRAISGLQTFTTYCAPRPMQVAMARTLCDPAGQAWIEAARDAYGRAAEQTARRLGLHTPESGTFAFFELHPFLRPGESPLELLARCARAGVVLTPGGATGLAYADWARLCYTSVSPDTLERALDALASVLFDSATPP
jgi:N-succinyldiaminopimelate aminotransferase